MTYFVERRKYQRCTSNMCRTAMSVDGIRWYDVDIIDISAGGLKFASGNDFDLTTKLHFDICFYNLLSEFNIRFHGYLIRKEKENGRIVYSVLFTNLSKYHQVQLDELIRSRVTVKNSNELLCDDGIYTFLCMPRAKASNTYVPRYR